MAHIVIAGGTGLIGQALNAALSQLDHQVSILSRQALANAIQWDGTQLNWPHASPPDVIINLCGTSIMQQRWTPRFKQTIRESRLAPTRALVEFINKQQTPIRLINASGIGYYGDNNATQDEQSPGKSPADFLSQLVCDWEQCLSPLNTEIHQAITLRIAVVLSTSGGMLQRLLPPFKYGLGATMGHANHFLSWIHLHDLTRAIIHLLSLNNPATCYNLSAPQACTQQAFADALAAACHRQRWFRIPAPILRLLMGESSDCVLSCQNIVPHALLDSGFTFEFADIDSALHDLLK